MDSNDNSSDGTGEPTDSNTLPSEEVPAELKQRIAELEQTSKEIALGGPTPHLRYPDSAHHLSHIIEYLEDMTEFIEAIQRGEEPDTELLYRHTPLSQIYRDDEKISQLVDEKYYGNQ